MAENQVRYLPLGDSALTVEFGNIICESLNIKAIKVARHVEKVGFPGFIEAVPAYASTSIFYDPITVRRCFPEYLPAFDAVRSLVEAAVENLGDEELNGSRLIEIPVDFSDAAGPDLALVAEHNSLSPEEVISIFTASSYRVYLLGFLPGFSYMGELDTRIGTPRKASPRQEVQAGSVGIAGRQTGIYSFSSPGGWQIIGRTDLPMFRPYEKEPCRLSPGDYVTFVEK